MYNKLLKYEHSLLYYIATILIATVCNAIKITKLSVPSIYLIQNQENSDPLILNCDYELNEDEENTFVIKWLLNEQNIYQWIPSKKQYPTAMLHMKNHINTNHTASNESIHKFRALAIPKPTFNMSGLYTCYVSSYTAEDKQSSYLQVIVPESDIHLRLTDTNDAGNIKVECTVKDIYPVPDVTIWVGENSTKIMTANKVTLDDTDGLYDVLVIGTVNKYLFNNKSRINCMLNIPGTNYSKWKDTSQYPNTSVKYSVSSSIGVLALVSLIFISNMVLCV